MRYTFDERSWNEMVRGNEEVFGLRTLSLIKMNAITYAKIATWPRDPTTVSPEGRNPGWLKPLKEELTEAFAKMGGEFDEIIRKSK